MDGSELVRPGEMEKTDARQAVAVRRAAGGAVGTSQGKGEATLGRYFFQVWHTWNHISWLSLSDVRHHGLS